MAEIDNQIFYAKRDPIEARLIDGLPEDGVRNFLNETDRNKLNQMAIDFGLMRPNEEVVTSEFSEFISEKGRLLSLKEYKYYLTIYRLTLEGPVSAKTIHENVWGLSFDEDLGDKENIWVGISRIREKIGKDAIVTVRGSGYVSLEALRRNNISLREYREKYC
jgi:DNA-binding response OmpR family regulator